MYDDDEFYEDDRCDNCGCALEGHYICRCCGYHVSYDDFVWNLLSEGIDDDFVIWWVEDDEA